MMTNTAKAITEFLFIGQEEPNLGSFDLVILLGNDDTTGTIDSLEELYKKGHFTDETLFVLSGKRGSLNRDSLKTEAQAMYDEIQLRNLDIDHIVLEEEATNSLENFINVKKLLEEIDSYQSILVICKAFLTRRALMCAISCGFNEEKLSFYGTVDKAGKNISKEDWTSSPESRKRVYEELERIGKYAAKGDISI